MSHFLPVTLVAWTLSSLPAQAQVTGPAAPPALGAEKSTGQGIRMDVALALVNVTVTDPYNRLVTGLDKDNFHVFEDGVPQEVVSFSSEDVPDLDWRRF